MSQLRLNLLMVTATIIMFVVTLAINELLFTKLELTAGINWIYLPAGIRLLCTLLFAEAGAIGLLLVSWSVCFFYFFPNDPVRSFAGGIIASAAPYLVYLAAKKYFGLSTTLSNLSPVRLLQCAATFSLASPFLHHLWFAIYENKPRLAESFLVMVIGDFCGSIIVLYIAKFVLTQIPRHTHQPRREAADS
ncbi:hypothetical protein [Massilia sp. HP4]|uniref:hypothetical protein n=1 Tax=Massilia sp. HP4 TaxID=2562316 RepID=UPI0010BFE1A2|nr:hypothetical protein [Massilia sp. HP4]